jgi:hypothetical protein
MMTPDEPADDLGLARRLKRRLVTAFLLAGANQRYDLRTGDQKVLQPIIDLVETAAQAHEIGRSGGHGFVRCAGVGY